jgi:hypothetical protein
MNSEYGFIAEDLFRSARQGDVMVEVILHHFLPDRLQMVLAQNPGSQGPDRVGHQMIEQEILTAENHRHHRL